VSRAKLAKILTELEDKNIEIGRAYERLKETQRYLSESEKLASIGKMSAGIAHELRNPMGAIANSLSVLKRYNSLEREDVELVKIVEDEMGRLNKLLEDFLNYSKPSRLDYRETDLHRLIDDAISVFQLNKSLNGIIVEKKYAQKIPLLNLDRDKIKQMLLNLFINAMQAMPEGGTLTIETQYKTSEDEVQLAVSDTGSGMSDEILSQIFQPFFTTKDKGLGLGLSIVHKIMKEHGGYVLISSEIGKGTKIELKFPVKFMKDPVGLSDTEGRSEAGSTEGGYGENIGG
jgi:two-component system sensor histidine kinase HydH